MRAKRIVTILLCAAFGGLLVYWFILQAPSEKARPYNPVSFRLKWLHQSQFAGIYVAQAKGFFNNAGIDCNIHPGGQDFNAVKLVASGSDDFGVWSADQVLIARSQQIPIVAIAVIYQESPVCFFSRQDSGVRTPQDFVGKKIAMQYGTNVRTEYVAMMMRAGVPLTSVTEIPSRYDLQRFLNGEVDIWNGYTINEPLVAEEHGVPVNIIKPSEYGVDMYADCIIASEKTVKERPDLVRHFLQAVVDGWRYALANREEAVKFVLEQDPHLNKAHELRMLDESAKLIFARNTTGNEIGKMDQAIWQKMLDELRAQDLLGPHPVAVADVYTNDFLPD